MRSWLSRRRPRNAIARHLVRIVQRFEALYGFKVSAFYIRTYHNELADWLTREELPKVHSELHRKGWERLQPPEHWGALVEDAKQRILRIPGEKGGTADAALRHFHLKRPPQVPRSLAGLQAYEIGDLLRNYERAWRVHMAGR